MGRNFSNIIFGLILVLLGGLILLNNLEALEFWEVFGKIWPVILVIVGLWLIFRRSHPEYAQIQEKLKKGFGDIILNPKSIETKGLAVSSGFGDVEINLTKTQFQDKENLVIVNLGFGDIRIMLPQDLPVSAKGNSFAGKVDILGKVADGVGNNLEHEDEGYSSEAKKLKINAKLGFGDIRIFRV
ncbi:MAG: hypothetical protein AMJ90_06470 [candidate division Zixibacteria bacterium SM23_73_2]|nr:MAG: hypothetical protein AMJ90_06470 [candidate division Zixibacteria bacterium SM23_73_2]